jgi:hypothetical protein
LATNACATLMKSGFGGLPDPRVILTPFVVSTCAAEAADVAGVWTTLAVASGVSSFGGAGKISTFATANGRPLTGKAGRGSITRPTAIARIAATVAATLIGRLSRTASADALPATKPSGSSSSSHTSVDAFSLRTPQSRESTLSQPILGWPPRIPDAGGACLPPDSDTSRSRISTIHELTGR